MPNLTPAGTTRLQRICAREERAGSSPRQPPQQEAQQAPTHAPAMAETEARDETTTAAKEEQNKENAPANVANPKRARKQTTLTKIMATKAAAAAAVKEHIPVVDRTPDHLPSFEFADPYASGSGLWQGLRDRERPDNEASEADIMDNIVTSVTTGNIDTEVAADPDELDLAMPVSGETDVEESDCDEAAGDGPMEVQSDDESQEMECDDEGSVAVADADGRVAIDLLRRPPNPLSGDPALVSHLPCVKSHPVHRVDRPLTELGSYYRDHTGILINFNTYV
eukprot:3775262-Pleurochrysis_carterae.AAC.1